VLLLSAAVTPDIGGIVCTMRDSFAHSVTGIIAEGPTAEVANFLIDNGQRCGANLGRRAMRWEKPEMKYRSLLVMSAVCAAASSAHAFTDCAGTVKSVSVNPNFLVVGFDSGLSFGVSIAPETAFSKIVSGLATTSMVTQGRLIARFGQSGLDCSRAKDRTDLIGLTSSLVQTETQPAGAPNRP